MQFNPTSHHHPYFNNTTHRVPPPLALHSSRNPSQRISQVSSSQRSRLGCPSTQRISTVSSQKMSVATRADLVGSINLINSQTYRTENMRNFSQQNICNSQKSSRNIILQGIPSVSSASYQINQQSRITTGPNQSIQAAYGIVTNIPNIASSHHYLNQQPNPYQQSPTASSYSSQFLENTTVMLKNNLTSSNTMLPSIPSTPSLPIKTQNSRLNKFKKIDTPILYNDKKPTITKCQPVLVGNVTIQNFQLPPRIREPPKIANRLYKSAVFGRNTQTPTRPVSRAHSTQTFGKKNKKRQVLIRCPHRSFISNKKIPVLGSYLSNDKSKNYMIRQMSTSKGAKVLASKIIGMQVLEVIPTQVIKIPLGKAELLKQSRQQASIMLDDLQSFYENPIIDQPTLIKKYSPQKSLRSYNDRRVSQSPDQSFLSMRSKRLGDNIKISVYRSPDVVIKKAQTISSGPKLTKHHIHRVAVQGKEVSVDKYKHLFNKESDNSSKKSSSPVAKYVEAANTYNISAVTPALNPYQDKNFRLQKQGSFIRQNLHVRSLTSPNLSTSALLLESIKTQIAQSPIINMGSNVNCIQTTTSITQTCEQFLQSRQQKFNSSNNVAIKKETNISRGNQSLTQSSQNIVRNIYQEPLDQLFGNQIQEIKLDTNNQFSEFHETLEFISKSQFTFEKFQTTLSLQNMNKHKYKIPHLSSDLEEDLKKLRLENERKKTQMEERWNMQFSKGFKEGRIEF